jgi:hypothetical protein
MGSVFLSPIGWRQYEFGLLQPAYRVKDWDYSTEHTTSGTALEAIKAGVIRVSQCPSQ